MWAQKHGILKDDIKEETPEYDTKTGRKKKRESVIGILHGCKNTLTGIVDVAMVGSCDKGTGLRCDKGCDKGTGLLT